MQRTAVNFRRKGSRAGMLLLALLLFRAYVPDGFMPASGVPFALELCPAAIAGMPPGHLHQHPGDPHQHPGSHTEFPACPFGSAPAAGPISHRLDIQSAGVAAPLAVVAFQTPLLSLRPQRTHQPRGPPSLS
jgi:hypothetical protein